jgi:hypothetical protein
MMEIKGEYGGWKMKKIGDADERGCGGLTRIKKK